MGRQKEKKIRQTKILPLRYQPSSQNSSFLKSDSNVISKQSVSRKMDSDSSIESLTFDLQEQEETFDDIDTKFKFEDDSPDK